MESFASQNLPEEPVDVTEHERNFGQQEPNPSTQVSKDEKNERQPVERELSTSSSSSDTIEPTADDTAVPPSADTPNTQEKSLVSESTSERDEKRTRPPPEPSPPSLAVDVTSMTSPVPIELRLGHKHRHHYRPARQTKYLNNLMPIVGFLELTNALDFPANVWNMTPVPTFAVGLMATGGSISIIASFLVFRDLYLCLRNIKLLREERRYLLQEKEKWEAAGDARRVSMTQAWLDLNFREVLWEAAERLLLDSLNGFSGILVGIGTILAIDGADPAAYAASNLLSGYVGNSFNVVYGAANTAFSIYMYVRSRACNKAVKQRLANSALKQKVLGHLRRHRIFALVNGATAFVAAIGSMVSAKHWQGYVVLIPCVFGAVFGNLFWRHVVGYDREFCQRRRVGVDVDAERNLVFSIDAIEILKNEQRDGLLEKKSGKELLEFMADNGMSEDFTARLLHDVGDKRQGLIAKRHKKHVDVEYDQLVGVDEDQLSRSASRVLKDVGHRRFVDQERMLAELWSCQLAQQLGRRGSILGPQTPTMDEV